MALKGLDIFKLSPKKNCKECGSPTCMAFCMKVAQGAIAIDKCPYFSDDAKAMLNEQTAPPMKTITFGKDHKLGGETVLFRHEKTLVNKNLYSVPVSTAMSDAEVDAKLAALTKIDYERIGERMYVELVYVKSHGGDADATVELVKKAMATDRALELLENTEFKVKVLRLPQRLVDGQYVKQDADDFIKYQGRDAFEKLLSGSANGMEFTLSQVADKYDLKEDKDRIAYAAEIAETLARLGDPVEREVYTTRAAEAADLPAEAMRMEVERARKRSYAKEKKQQERREMNPVSDRQPIERGMRYANMRSAMAEEGVIRLLLQDDSLFPEQMPVLPEDFSSPALAHIYDEMWKRRGRGGVASLAAVLGPEEMDHLTVILQKPESAANAPQALADYIRIIQEEYNKRAGDLDPLAAACKTYKDKKGYGGKRT